MSGIPNVASPRAAPRTLPPMTDTPPPAKDDPAAVVLAALAKNIHPSSPEELAAATGLTEPTVRRTLGRLVAKREARRAGGNRFTASRHR